MRQPAHTPYSKNASAVPDLGQLALEISGVRFGMRTALDQQKLCRNAGHASASAIGPELAADIVNAPQKTEAEIDASVSAEILSAKLAGIDSSTRATCWPLRNAGSQEVWILV